MDAGDVAFLDTRRYEETPEEGTVRFVPQCRAKVIESSMQCLQEQSVSQTALMEGTSESTPRRRGRALSDRIASTLYEIWLPAKTLPEKR
jgi:hypothetical protein